MSDTAVEWTDDFDAREFLYGNGWKLTETFWWVKPSPDHQPTPSELSAVDYLFADWDFGGILS